MRKLLGLFSVCALVGVAAGVNGAGATPPSGQFSAEEHGRAQQMADAKVVVRSGHDVLSSTYTVEPGGDTGWRTGPGTTALAVTKGTLKIDLAEGCASRDVAAGNSLVLPPGQFRLHNAGQEPVELLANFTGLPNGGGAPWVDEPADPAPACAGFAAAAVPNGVSTSKAFRGDVSPYFDQTSHAGHGGGAAHDGYATKELSVAAGKDTFMTTILLQPGYSTGWFAHTEHVAIITKGSWAFYEPRDGKCEKVEEYHAGDAWAHVVHRHLGAVQGNEPAEVTLFGFNLKHGEPMPVLGSNPDHLDFAHGPPSECPTQLR
jgi:quercetin dioxygenase-like cupin family protein